MLRAPEDLNVQFGCGCSTGMGDSASNCPRGGGLLITAAVLGALTYWLLPGAVTGLIDGVKHGVETQRQKMRA